MFITILNSISTKGNNMSQEYFKKFPIINYNNQTAINIARRVSFNDRSKRYISNFYPHSMNNGDKIEHLAFDYYGNVNYDWLIYHANEMVDPYYDVYLDDLSFREYIIKKYKTEYRAQRKVVFYENNYQNDDTIISVERYVTLANRQKKYWQPIMSFTDIAGYERSREDFRANTNKIIQINFEEGNDNILKGENLITDNEFALAEVVFVNFDTCLLQHVRGEFFRDTTFTVTGELSRVMKTITPDSYKVLYEPIKPEEEIYYSPVFAYDFEMRENQKKKDIMLVDKRYSEELDIALAELLRD